MLKRLVFYPTGQHQTTMHIIVHAIGLCSARHRIRNAQLVHPHVQRNGFAGIKEPVHVLVKKRPHPIIKTHAFPDAVAQHKATVID